MTLPWFRFYHEFAGDPVLQGLAFEDQRHYVMVLCLKASGLLDREFPSPDFRHRMIVRALGLDPLAGAEVSRRLREVGLIDESWQPPAWDKRQFKSDNSTTRVQKFRSQKESKKDLDTDTEGNVSSNVSETLPIRKVAQRIPEDFGITPERQAYAEKELPKVDSARLMAAFVDHWKAASGPKARKLDWDAAWRTWVRNCNEFGYPMKRPEPNATSAQRFDRHGNPINA